MVVYVFIFGNLALGFLIDGRWQAVGGVAILAGVSAVAAILVADGLRRARGRRQDDARRRRREAQLAARADQEHQAMMRGDIEAGVFGAFQPPRLDRNDLPDADQMRAQAWQPDMADAPPAVRPNNPAPWHVVSQWPTRQSHKPTQS